MTLLSWEGASDDEKDGKDDDAKGEGEGAACLFCGRCHEQRQPTASDARLSQAEVRIRTTYEPSCNCTLHRPVIKDDEDMLKLFEKLPDYLISEDNLEQTATVLKVFIRSLRPNCFHNLIL